MKVVKGHEFDTERRCHCGRHHYTCQKCGVDCTAGTSGGPCTQDVDGVRRCWRCQRTHERRVGFLHAAAGDLLKAARLGLRELRALGRGAAPAARALADAIGKARAPREKSA